MMNHVSLNLIVFSEKLITYMMSKLEICLITPLLSVSVLSC